MAPMVLKHFHRSVEVVNDILLLYLHYFLVTNQTENVNVITFLIIVKVFNCLFNINFVCESYVVILFCHVKKQLSSGWLPLTINQTKIERY